LQTREGEEKGEGEAREEERRGGVGGRQREGGQEARERKPDTQNMLGEHRSCRGHAQ
jgi:hypothetical protein